MRLFLPAHVAAGVCGKAWIAIAARFAYRRGAMMDEWRVEGAILRTVIVRLRRYWSMNFRFWSILGIDFVATV